MSDDEIVRRLIDVAVARQQAGALAEAVAGCRRALALAPASGPAFRSLALTMNVGGRADLAIDPARRAVAVHPFDAIAWLLWGYAEIQLGRSETAARVFRRTTTLIPGNADALNNLAAALAHHAGPVPTALWAGRALALASGTPETRFNRATAWLGLGRWADAWPDHEHRLALQRSYPHALKGAAWRGEASQAMRLLVHDEIGYGDVFNHLRYLPLARARVGRLILEVKPGLKRLLAGYPGTDAVVERGTAAPDPATYDAFVGIESLPGIFGTTPDNVPPAEPKPHPPAYIGARWKARLGPASGKRIGLVWAGSAASRFDAARSMRLGDLAPLAAIGGIDWISLQRDDAEREVAAGVFPAPMRSLGPELSDFADTAAVLETLDAVVTVETAVAHLAGSLGRPTCLLLARWPAWRWLLDRGDTPWYRSMRLFRQQKAGDWTDPVAAVRDYLRAL